jgi:demethylmenaquinone methyltransferase/2-methoxy-6-polyprenyl-1,4-benzoquinol methylase
MFSSIAPRYDFLNRLLSLGRDQVWRRSAVSQIPLLENGIILDIATGTGDIALALARIQPKSTRIIGLDFSSPMLKIAYQKITKEGLDKQIKIALADALFLPLGTETVNAAIIAFGLRNFVDPAQGLAEIYRVIRPGGHLVILEFSIPKNYLFQRLYHIYFLKILPRLGGMVSKNHKAYHYLPESVLAFPQGNSLKERLMKNGFQEVHYYPLTGGIAMVYTARKN